MFIPSNTTNEMYVLRHFREVPEKYLQSLLGKPYKFYDRRKKRFVRSLVSTRAIERALRAREKSKFFSGLPGLETPRAVIARVRREAKSQKLQWLDNGAYRAATFTFLHSILVGTDISTRSKRRTRRIGVELAWYKGMRSAYVTAYPCFYDERPVGV